MHSIINNDNSNGDVFLGGRAISLLQSLAQFQGDMQHEMAQTNCCILSLLGSTRQKKKGPQTLESGTVQQAGPRFTLNTAQKVKVLNSRFSPTSCVSVYHFPTRHLWPEPDFD